MGRGPGARGLPLAGEACMQADVAQAHATIDGTRRSYAVGTHRARPGHDAFDQRRTFYGPTLAR